MVDITQEHPEYAGKRALFAKYRDLYTGGEQIKRNASEYLTPRQKEPLDIYSERMSRVFYENYLGSIVDWYAATLFRREPVLTFEGDDPAATQFFNYFADNCNLKGTSITDFFRGRMIETLICGTSYFIADFPRAIRPAINRAEEDALGTSRAYFIECNADDLVNWSRDERGDFDWVVIRTEALRRARVEDPDWIRETRWTLFDRTRFKRFQRLDVGTQLGTVELVDEGYHAFATQGVVPLFELRVSDGLWLMNKAALLQLEHFNKSNALSWALTMGLFAMPVIYSERPWDQVVGESYFIQLNPEDRFGWTEPEGKVFQVASDNLARLKEEIYRVCYLLSHSGSLHGGIQQSGLSKLRDFAITQEVLRAYGDTVKDVMRRALCMIATARGDDIKVGVSGLDDFDIGDFGSELSDATSLLALKIESTTLRRQIFKKLAFKYLSDVNQEMKDQIAREIDIWCEGTS